MLAPDGSLTRSNTTRRAGTSSPAQPSSATSRALAAALADVQDELARRRQLAEDHRVVDASQLPIDSAIAPLMAVADLLEVFAMPDLGRSPAVRVSNELRGEVNTRIEATLDEGRAVDVHRAVGMNRPALDPLRHGAGRTRARGSPAGRCLRPGVDDVWA